MVLRKTVSRGQLLSNSRAWRTTSRRTTSHKRLARTAKTNLESLLLERLLLHLCVLARAHHRKGSLHRLCRERVLLRVIDTLRFIGFGLPSTNQAQGEYTRCITEHAPAKSVDSDLGVADSHRQTITNNAIHMRCSHHTHWAHAPLPRREKIGKNIFSREYVGIKRCGGSERKTMLGSLLSEDGSGRQQSAFGVG